MKTPKSRGERTRPSGLLRIAAVLVLLSVLSAVRVRAGLETSGWWSDKSPEFKGNAIHLAVLPGSPNAAWDASLNHSYVVWWRGRDHQCTTATNDSLIGGLWGFKPWRGTSTNSDPLQGFTMLPFGTTDVDVFCSGATALPGAKLLIGGGAMAENNGITASYLFDPSASAASQFTRFSASSEMTHPRWYPTLTVDQNGDARVFAGLKFNHMLNVMGLSGRRAR